VIAYAIESPRMVMKIEKLILGCACAVMVTLLVPARYDIPSKQTSYATVDSPAPRESPRDQRRCPQGIYLDKGKIAKGAAATGQRSNGSR
jgi:hypothetical protein